MKYLGLVCLILALGKFVYLISGIASSVITFLEAFFSGILCVALLITGYGIHKKELTGWRSGFVVIVVSAVYFPVEVYINEVSRDEPFNIVAFAISIVCAPFVAAYWIWIWYRQKSFFSQRYSYTSSKLNRRAEQGDGGDT